MPADGRPPAADVPATFELQAAIVAAARASGQPCSTPGAASRTGSPPSPAPASSASASSPWPRPPRPARTRCGASRRRRPASPRARRRPRRRRTTSARSSSPRPSTSASRSSASSPTRGSHELVRAVLGAGYPTPTRMLPHLEQVLERYLVDVTGSDPGPPGRFHVFGTEGGAAAMAYVFRDAAGEPHRRAGRRHRHRHADLHAVPPDPRARGLRVPRRRAARRPQHAVPLRRRLPRAAARPDDQGLLRRQPGQPRQPGDPAGEAGPAAATSCSSKRPDLVIVADTVYATFVDGFRSIAGRPPPPRHLPALVLQELRRHRQPPRLRRRARRQRPRRAARRAAGRRRDRRSPTATDRSRPTSTALPFVSRLVADSREVALHNIAGLATPDQVQMALFALAYLMPSGSGLRARHARRAGDPPRRPAWRRSASPRPAVRTACTTPSSTLLAVAHARGGLALAEHLAEHVEPAEIPMRLAREHGVVVLPGQIFDARAGTCGCRWRRSPRPS